MKKYIIAAMVSLIVFTSLIIVSVSLEKRDLAETIENKPDSIERIKLDIPSDHTYKSTTDPVKIDELLDHFGAVTYERLPGNQSTYFPSRASIIYLYNQDNYSDFIVPYGSEVMINHTVYKVKNGTLASDWLNQYYQSLD